MDLKYTPRAFSSDLRKRVSPVSTPRSCIPSVTWGKGSILIATPGGRQGCTNFRHPSPAPRTLRSRWPAEKLFLWALLGVRMKFTMKDDQGREYELDGPEKPDEYSGNEWRVTTPEGCCHRAMLSGREISGEKWTPEQIRKGVLRAVRLYEVSSKSKEGGNRTITVTRRHIRETNS